jgi:hypothetical protein
VLDIKHHAAQKAARSYHMQTLVHVNAGGGSRSGSGSRMASGAGQHGADIKMNMLTLPPEMLQHICRLLDDPDDLASFHLVNTRYVLWECECLHQVRRTLLAWCCIPPCCCISPCTAVIGHHAVQILRSSKGHAAQCRATAPGLP